MTKGKNTAAIGKREERAIVKDLEKLGYRCRRQPGSGNRAVDLQHDVLWHDSPAGKLHIEDKYREKSQWQRLENYRAGADILTVREARGERMAFLSWNLLLELVGPAGLESLDTEEICPVPDNIEIAPMCEEVGKEILRRARIQSAHQNPPQKPLTKRKLEGRGFSKKQKAPARTTGQ